MSYLLFFIYLVVFCWLLTRIKFIRDTGLTNQVIVFLFLIKIVGGIINGYVNLYYYPYTDIAAFQQEGIIEYHLLFNDPKEYFTNIFSFHHQNSGLLDMSDSYWNNLRSNLVIKLLSIFNIFSRGDFFINTIFYNFLIFFGSVSFYRIFIRIFPDRKMVLIIALFLLPSLVYFTSGIHKDGLIFLGLGICCFNLFFIITKGFSLQKMVWFLTGLIMIFLLRNFVLITLIPAIIAWVIAEKNRKYTTWIFIAVYLFFIVLFFNLGSLHPSLDLPKYVSERQIAFVEISKAGKSAIHINPLFPHFRSFFNNSPQALNHSLMRPYITEQYSLLYLPVAIEILVCQILLLLFLFFRIKKNNPEPLIYFGIFFGISMFLMIGYTIPIIGAIVRYRSIYFPLLLIPVVCYTDWRKIKDLLRINK